MLITLLRRRSCQRLPLLKAVKAKQSSKDIAKAFGVDESHTLPSCRALGALLSQTMEWLVMERVHSQFRLESGTL